MPQDEKLFLKIKQDKTKQSGKMANCKEYKKFLIILKNKNMQKQEIKGRKCKNIKKSKKQK